MKLVLQIAAGIVLAGLIIWGGSLAVTVFVAKQAAQQMQETARNIQQQQLRAQQERQRQADLQKLAQEREAAAQRLEQQRLQKQQQAALAERAKMVAAFEKSWQAPGWCENTSDPNVFIRCKVLRNSELAEFSKGWSGGK